MVQSVIYLLCKGGSEFRPLTPVEEAAQSVPGTPDLTCDPRKAEAGGQGLYVQLV